MPPKRLQGLLPAAFGGSPCRLPEETRRAQNGHLQLQVTVEEILDEPQFDWSHGPGLTYIDPVSTNHSNDGQYISQSH